MKLGGKVGVCFATSGPGATNLVTGIATAYMDSVPLVAITCNYATSGLGRDSFQEVDICGCEFQGVSRFGALVEPDGDCGDVFALGQVDRHINTKHKRKQEE